MTDHQNSSAESAHPLAELPEYLDCLESELIDLDVDMSLSGSIIPPGVWADRVRASIVQSPDVAQPTLPGRQDIARMLWIKTRHYDPTDHQLAASDSGRECLALADAVLAMFASQPSPAATVVKSNAGFFGNLTPEQQKTALEYDGPENHGDPAYAHSSHRTEAHMRRRELIRKLKEDRQELRRNPGFLFISLAERQQVAERRMVLLHALENLLPEIIEKLEASS